MEPKVIVGKTGEEVASELIKVVKNVVDVNPKSYIGLSGGSLPKFLAAGLKTDVGRSINWSQVTFLFCDERMVPITDPESTLGIYLNLLSDVIKEEQYLKVAVDLEVEAAAKDYEEKIKSRLGDKPQFDLLLLGMGPDGHTCSLFPGHGLLDEKDKIVAAIKDSPKPPAERVTLTLSVLNDAKNLAFVSTGEGKKEMIKNVIKDKIDTFPATRVRPNNGELFWIVDEPAASML